MKAIQLKKEFDKLKSSDDQYVWLINMLDRISLKVTLDNDATWITFGQDKEGEDLTSDFNDHLGNSHGVVLLLTSIGLEVVMC